MKLKSRIYCEVVKSRNEPFNDILHSEIPTAITSREMKNDEMSRLMIDDSDIKKKDEKISILPSFMGFFLPLHIEKNELNLQIKIQN